MRRIVVYTLVATVIGAGFFYLAIREIEIDTVLQFWRQTDPIKMAGASALFMLMYAVCHLARIARWYELVSPIAPVERGLVMRVAAVGFGAIILLPLRLGEFVRPILLARKTQISMTSALGTAVVERVVDGLTITGLLFLTLATYDGEKATASVRAIGLVSAAVFVPALLMCLLAWWRRESAIWLLQTTIGRFFPSFSDKLKGLLLAFIDGLFALTRAQALVRFLGFSVVYWSLNGLSMWALARFGFGLEIGPWESMTVLSVLVVGIMIPAGPAMAGNFEYFLLQGLGLFVALEGEKTLGAIGAFAASLHVLQFIVILSPAFYVMLKDPESRGLLKIASATQDPEVEN